MSAEDERDAVLDVDPRLTALLRDAGNEWGPLGVVNTAARLWPDSFDHVVKRAVEQVLHTQMLDRNRRSIDRELGEWDRLLADREPDAEPGAKDDPGPRWQARVRRWDRWGSQAWYVTASVGGMDHAYAWAWTEAGARRKATRMYRRWLRDQDPTDYVLTDRDLATKPSLL